MSASSPVVASTSLHALSELPKLASNPSASAKLYLDFDGNFESQWSSFRNITSPVFSLDADRTTFSDWELATIHDVWAAVAEDFAPFNLDVTTIEPSDFNNGHALRVVIGGSPNDWYGSSCGGVALTNSFTNNEPNVAFVFSDYGWPSRNQGQFLADVVSHEAGHGFGLSHQAEYDANGNFVNCYRRGDDHSAPIMGSTEASQRSVWDNATSTSATTTQDDLSVIARAANGFGFRADDHGDNADSATNLSLQGGQFTAQGIISQTSDQDVFRFHSDGGTAVFTVSTNPFGANLVVQAKLQDASGQTLVSTMGNDTDPASLRASLPVGDYLIVVTNNGEYGSLGGYSLVGAVTPEPSTTPLAPTSFTATSQYGYRHEVTWTAVANATAYRIYRRARAGTAESLIETLPAGTTQATIAVARTPFATQSDRWFGQYRVEAVNDRGTASTEWQSVTHQFVVPSQTKNLELEALSETSVRLTWQVDPTAQFQKIVVMQYIDQSATTFFYERTVLLPVNQTGVTLEGLVSGKRYSFAITGVNPAGRSGATYQFSMPHSAAPERPDVTAVVMPGRIINLAWSPVPGATSYYVSELTNQGTWRKATLPATTTSFQVTGLAVNKPYRFIVEAVNANGATASVTESLTIPYNPPAQATGVTITALSSTSVRVNWNGVSGVDGYRISLAGSSTILATLAAGQTSFTITGLTANTNYSICVSAFNVSGTSSAWVWGRTLPNAPTAPENFAATAASPTSVRLTWNDSLGETSYRVERIENGTTTSLTISSGSTSFNANSLAANREYQFRIVAVNTSGIAATNWITVRTPEAPPRAPSGLRATSVTQTSAILTWFDSTNETGSIRAWPALSNWSRHSGPTRRSSLSTVCPKGRPIAFE